MQFDSRYHWERGRPRPHRGGGREVFAQQLPSLRFSLGARCGRGPLRSQCCGSSRGCNI